MTASNRGGPSATAVPTMVASLEHVLAVVWRPLDRDPDPRAGSRLQPEGRHRRAAGLSGEHLEQGVAVVDGAMTVVKQPAAVHEVAEFGLVEAEVVPRHLRHRAGPGSVAEAAVGPLAEPRAHEHAERADHRTDPPLDIVHGGHLADLDHLMGAVVRADGLDVDQSPRAGDSGSDRIVEVSEVGCTSLGLLTAASAYLRRWATEPS